MRKVYTVLAVLVGLFLSYQILIFLNDRAITRLPLRITDSTAARDSLGRRARALLRAGRFDALERVADSLTTNQVRWPDGQWKIGAFCVEGFGFLEPDAGDADWRRLIEGTEQWQQAYPASITAPVALAEAWVGYAWFARGDGYASSVKPGGWDLFHERLGRAYSVLDDARRLPARSPVWYSAIQKVAVGVGWDDDKYQPLLHEALHAHPDYVAYYLLAAWRIEPKWGGRTGDWERFAEAVTDTLPTPLGDEMYARIVLDQSKNYRNVFKESAASWEHTERGLQSLARRYPDSIEIATACLWLSALAGDREQMRLAASRLGDRLDVGVAGNERFLRQVMIHFRRVT